MIVLCERRHNVNMVGFLCVYIGLSVIAAGVTFALSYRETPHNKCKALLLAVYILTIVGVLFATGVLEAKYGWNRLCSTLIAAAVLGGLYLADTLGTKAKQKKN